ncbi:MAG: NAD-dependent DNA ligase [Selenomonas sp.]|nr:NAD-dependent DNA ligase [Selenomonas sp.]
MDTIVKEIRDCAATLSRIADMLAKQEQSPEVAAPTLEEVRTVLAELSRNGLTAQVRELLQKHGVGRLSEVNPAEYAAILKEAESIGK